MTKDYRDSMRIANPNGKPGPEIAIAGGSGQGLPSGVQSFYHFTITSICVASSRVLAPGDRYQVLQRYLTDSGAPLVQQLCDQLTQEEHRLWPIWPTGKYTP